MLYTFPTNRSRCQFSNYHGLLNSNQRGSLKEKYADMIIKTVPFTHSITNAHPSANIVHPFSYSELELVRLSVPPY